MKLPLKMDVRGEQWPLKQPFVISRGSSTTANVLVVTLSDGQHTGRGEACPTRRYGQTLQSITRELEAFRSQIEPGVSRGDIHKMFSKGAARNALDCALWDLECKRSGKTIWELTGLDRPDDLPTVITITLDTPEKMAEQASKFRDWPVFKLKLGAAGDLERVQAVHDAVPSARLIADINEGWTAQQLADFMTPLAHLGVELLEQPLPAAEDDALKELKSPIPLAADESFHDVRSIEKVLGKYQVINIKLDKTGGLSEALRVVEAARRHKLRLMTGCMLGTSLAMAPGFVIASQCEFIDLDGPVSMVKDREHGMQYARGRVAAFMPELWG
jgi:L-Ala-D/L-Glu epimerase